MAVRSDSGRLLKRVAQHNGAKVHLSLGRCLAWLRGCRPFFRKLWQSCSPVCHWALTIEKVVGLDQGTAYRTQMSWLRMGLPARNTMRTVLYDAREGRGQQVGACHLDESLDNATLRPLFLTAIHVESGLRQRRTVGLTPFCQRQSLGRSSPRSIDRPSRLLTESRNRSQTLRSLYSMARKTLQGRVNRQKECVTTSLGFHVSSTLAHAALVDFFFQCKKLLLS